MPRCKICGKELTNPVSIVIGVGPVCRGENIHKERSTPNMFPSEYSYHFDEGILVIIDHGGVKSVTNDMENIIAKIESDKGISISDCPIMYKDSIGVFDAVKYIGFSVEFKGLGKQDYTEAKDSMKKLIGTDYYGNKACPETGV